MAQRKPLGSRLLVTLSNTTEGARSATAWGTAGDSEL